MTLSLHQPWASLLVLGIKRAEGRGWSTPYRGRLWIASTSQEPEAEDVAALEAEYRAVYDMLTPPFPSSYPRSAVLGCVDLVDVMEQERWQRWRRARGQREDSQSAFVFICERPRVLQLPVSVSGQHKLWQLSRQMVEGLQKQLVDVSERWRTGKARGKEEAEGSVAASGSKRKTLIVKQKKGPRLPNEP